MAKQISLEKRFRQRVEYHKKEIENTVGFQSDAEWLKLVVSKILELSDPVNTDQIAFLTALMEVWGNDRGIDE